jgi:hypothetical protein
MYISITIIQLVNLLGSLLYNLLAQTTQLSFNGRDGGRRIADLVALERVLDPPSVCIDEGQLAAVIWRG